jgi:hypothetical protein
MKLMVVHLYRQCKSQAAALASTPLAPGGQQEVVMRNIVLTPPLLGFIVGTRAALGFGVGLLVAGRIPPERRRTLGVLFVALGAATTVPAAMTVLRGRRLADVQPAA